MKPKPACPPRTTIALQYDPTRDQTPRITAEGNGHVAEKIMARAREKGIPMREDPDLVLVLSQFHLNQEIPPSFYQVVAELLALVYRLNQDYRPLSS